MLHDRTTQKQQLEQKKEQLVSLIKNSECADEMEISKSWKEVERRVEEISSGKRRRRYIMQIVAAASIALIVAVSSIYFRNTKEFSIVSELQNGILTDSIKHVSLILSNHHKIEVKNGSSISYNPKGQVAVNAQEIKKENQEEETTEKSSPLNHVIVPLGKQIHLTLSDGTKLYINAGSHVIYPTVFNNEKREIAVEGEVYLEVAPNPDSPFVVKTSGMDVTVLGTVFNISAYKDKTASVVLVKGSVEVESADKKVLLQPSQMASIERGEIMTKAVDVNDYICWKDNLILLNEKPLEEVIDQISRYYGVSITYDRSNAKQMLSGKLDLCDTIDDVIGILKEFVNIEVEQ